MGEPACDLLDAELALDRLDAELAMELPAHVRAFATAYARGDAPPAAPAVLRSQRAIDAARHGCMHELLADRGRALLRLVAPVVIESDPEVSRLRAASPSWDGLARLTAARDAIATARFGERAIAMLHRLHVVATPSVAPSRIPELPAWHSRDAAATDADVHAAWRTVAARFRVTGSLRFEHLSAEARQPRTFVVEPGREVIVVLPSTLDTPASRFAALHELGHAAAALASPIALPRALDEAIASLAARLAETNALAAPWSSPLAAAARIRRLAIAATLDALERRLPELPAEPPAPRPPSALWHDPGAQAAYVTAEAFADELARDPRPLADVLAERVAVTR